eukprot:Em0001g2966a
MNVTVLANSAAQALGYSSLKEHQIEVVLAVAGGRDVFAVLPTGYGKSLCYACLPGLFDSMLDPHVHARSIVVVLTPLTAIIQDQVASFSSRGLETGYITSTADAAMIEKVVNGRCQLVFFTPEALLESRKWSRLLQSEEYSTRVKVLVIDEAHTVKKWGETFRQTLMRVGEIRSLLPENVAILALTATATTQLRRQVTSIIGLRDPVVVSISACKKNICYAVSSHSTIFETFNPLLEKIKLLKLSLHRVIIYCRRLKDCSMLYKFFKKDWERTLQILLVLLICPDSGSWTCLPAVLMTM